jgi:hypothetical protein
MERWRAVGPSGMVRALAHKGLVLVAVLATAGCGGTVTDHSSAGGAAGSGGTGAIGGSSGFGGFGGFGGFSGSSGFGGVPDAGPPDSGPDASRDAASDFRDPGCPDAAPLPVDDECDLFHQPSGCPAGQACYPYVNYPNKPCQQEQYGTLCSPPGVGKQGDPCDNGDGCAGGFVCVITGQGDQCVQDCPISGPNTCPEGLFCEPVDVKGVGGCF